MILNNCTTTTTTNGSYINQFLPLITHRDFDPLIFEGSSTGSILSEDPPSFDSGYDCGSKKVCALEQSFGVKGGPDNMFPVEPSLKCKEPSCSNYLCRQEMEDLISDCGELVEEKEEDTSMKVSMRPQGERFRSKNLITERKRRDRLKDRLYTLRGLVPKITKMDRLSTLVDSITFIKELQKKVIELEDELKNDMEGLTNKNLNLAAEKKQILEVAAAAAGGVELIKEVESKHKQEAASSEQQTTLEMEAQVEVKQTSVKEFFVKLYCEEKRGGFAKMMEAMNCLGLQVTDANVTTFKGMVLNILKVEQAADTHEVVQAQKLKDLLLDLTRYNNGAARSLSHF